MTYIYLADAELKEGAEVLSALQRRVETFGRSYQNIASFFENQHVTDGLQLWTTTYKRSLDGLLSMISFGDCQSTSLDQPRAPSSTGEQCEEEEEDPELVASAPEIPVPTKKRAGSVGTDPSEDLQMPHSKKKRQKRDIRGLLESKISEVLKVELSATDQAKIPELVTKLLGIFLLSSSSIAGATTSQHDLSDLENSEPDCEPLTEPECEPPAEMWMSRRTRSQTNKSDSDESLIELTPVNEESPRYLRHSPDR